MTATLPRDLDRDDPLAHLIDQPGQPTLAARDEILTFFAERLRPLWRRARP